MTASIHSLTTKRTASLDALMALVAGDMNGVNAVILERMQSQIALIPELAGHLSTDAILNDWAEPSIRLVAVPLDQLAVPQPVG